MGQNRAYHSWCKQPLLQCRLIVCDSFTSSGQLSTQKSVHSVLFFLSINRWILTLQNTNEDKASLHQTRFWLTFNKDNKIITAWDGTIKICKPQKSIVIVQLSIKSISMRATCMTYPKGHTWSIIYATNVAVYCYSEYFNKPYWHSDIHVCICSGETSHVICCVSYDPKTTQR